MSRPKEIPEPSKVVRRWRIGIPPLPQMHETLEAERSSIELVFLEPPNSGTYIGKRTIPDSGTTFFASTRTEEGATRTESGRVITETEFRKLEKRRDKTRRTILKARWGFDFKGMRFHLDIFIDPPRKAFLESEPVDPSVAIELPTDFLDICEEVTGDPTTNDDHLALLS